MNFGIIGCGVIAHTHAQAIASIEGATLLGVTDYSFSYAQTFAQNYNVNVYDDYEDMLADPDIDIICICTPSGLHATQAIQALEHQKHVVLEKPMALTAADADDIIAAAKANNRLVTVISQMRFSDDIQKLKQLLTENAFGKLLFCDLIMKYWRDPSYYASSNWKGTYAMDGGGALMNQGIHGVDLLIHLAGEPSVLRGKVKTRIHNIEVEDTAAALLEFEHGALGVIEAATSTAPGFERRLEITGERGYVILQENEIIKLMLDGELLISKETGSAVTGAHNAAAPPCTLHAKQILNLLHAIEGTETLMVSGVDGRKAVKVIQDIYESSIMD